MSFERPASWYEPDDEEQDFMEGDEQSEPEMDLEDEDDGCLAKILDKFYERLERHICKR